MIYLWDGCFCFLDTQDILPFCYHFFSYIISNNVSLFSTDKRIRIDEIAQKWKYLGWDKYLEVSQKLMIHPKYLYGAQCKYGPNYVTRSFVFRLSASAIKCLAPVQHMYRSQPCIS